MGNHLAPVPPLQPVAYVAVFARENARLRAALTDWRGAESGSFRVPIAPATATRPEIRLVVGVHTGRVGNRARDLAASTFPTFAETLLEVVSNNVAHFWSDPAAGYQHGSIGYKTRGRRASDNAAAIQAEIARLRAHYAAPHAHSS
jgi:hypothetical protein